MHTVEFVLITKVMKFKHTDERTGDCSEQYLVVLVGNDMRSRNSDIWFG